MQSIRKKDRAGLEAVLGANYQIDHVPLPVYSGDPLDRGTMLKAWTDPKVTVELMFKTTRLRILGDTAIESGEYSGQIKLGLEKRAWGHFGGCPYIRVWMKDKTVWKLVHEKH